MVEYTNAIRNSESIQVPKGCVPLIGYNKKPSTILKIENDGRNFLDEREAALSLFKRKNGKPKLQIRVKSKKTEKTSLELEAPEPDIITVEENVKIEDYEDLLTKKIKSERSSKV